VGNLVCFKRDVVSFFLDGEPNQDSEVIETVVKAVLIRDGMETCTVGFLPQHITMRHPQVECLTGKFTQIIELYGLCEIGSYKKKKSERNSGIASFVLLDDIPEME
jgi:hypothetical protein